MKRSCLTVFLLVAFFALSRGADLQVAPADLVDAVAILPPPPAAGSQEAAAEIDVVLKLQSQRSDAEISRAQSEEKLSPTAFQEVLGKDFTAEKYPNVFGLLNEGASDAKGPTTAAKRYYARARPRFADDRVKTLFEQETDPAYPSGHATRGMLWAEILCELVPEKKEALLSRGEEIGWDRVMAGVHRPDDVYAGRVLGQAIAHVLLKDPDFIARLAKAKVEFATASNTESVRQPRQPGDNPPPVSIPKN